MREFLLDIGKFTLGIIIIILIVFIASAVSYFYKRISNKTSITKAKIFSSIFAVVLTAVIGVSLYSVYLHSKSGISIDRIVNISSRIKVGDEAYLFFKGKPEERYSVIIYDYFDDDIVDEQRTDTDGLAVFNWLVTYSVEPGTYTVVVQNNDLEEVATSEFIITE